jgi:hypothetical protein
MSLNEALILSAPKATRGRRIDAGPWDELACWYWNLYDEIDDNLYKPVLDDRATKSCAREYSIAERSSGQNKLPEIPPKPFRDELVCLYFKHIHPLCPIFDEVEFHSIYYEDEDDLAFLQCISLLEFQAMMFAASLVRFLPKFNVPSIYESKANNQFSI